jgi:hypothetical protein
VSLREDEFATDVGVLSGRRIVVLLTRRSSWAALGATLAWSRRADLAKRGAFLNPLWSA